MVQRFIRKNNILLIYRSNCLDYISVVLGEIVLATVEING